MTALAADGMPGKPGHFVDKVVMRKKIRKIGCDRRCEKCDEEKRREMMVEVALVVDEEMLGLGK